MNYLLRSAANYADEFDIEGLLEITETQRNKLTSHSMSMSSYHGIIEDEPNWEEDGDICFGTNEFVFYQDVELVIVEVTDEELLIIKRVHGVDENKKLNVGTLNLESHL